MKVNIFILAFLSIAGCSSSGTEQKGYGFGPVNSVPLTNSITRAETIGNGDSYPSQSGRSPGLYQTKTGVPLLVFNSSSVSKGGPPLQGTVAMRSAVSYVSSKWNSPYAMRMKGNEGDALYRVVTVDGTSFVVMKSIRPKNLVKGLFSNEAYFQIMDEGIKKSGCTRAGKTVARSAKGAVQSLAAPVIC